MKRFTRKEGYVGGVCEGLGEYTGIDPIFWRFAVIFFGLHIPYLIAWAFTPKG
jgi:phage shock protein PspC (stress-responsive transcriptional regulator)